MIVLQVIGATVLVLVGLGLAECLVFYLIGDSD